MQDKKPYNDKQQAHGYWEVYYSNGQLHFKGNFTDGDADGQYLAYAQDGTLVLDAYFIKGVMIRGLCKHLSDKLYYAK